MNNLNFNGLLMTAAGLLGTSSVLEIPDKIRDLQAENARLRECVRAGEALLDYLIPSCTVRGTTCRTYGEVNLHSQDCLYVEKSEAYTRAREAVD